MNFQEIRLMENLTSNISSIQEDLNRYKDLSRVKLFTLCINEKLRAAVMKYNYQLDLDNEYLLRKRITDVLKAITKQQKAEDKKILDEIISKESDKNE